MRPVRVLAADRQPLFREALARAVRRSPALRLIAESADGREALGAIEAGAPDVAMVDLCLPLVDGRRVLNAVVRDELPTRVVLLAGRFDDRTAYEALAGGAAGLLPRTIDEVRLRAAVTAVAAGEVVLGEREQTAVAAEIRRRSDTAAPLLSGPERALLLGLAAGRRPADVAAAAGLSAAATKAMLLRLHRRFGVSDRTALVALALRRGLIE